MLASVAPLSFALNAHVVPAIKAARASGPVMGVETQLGAVGPLGYWDPLGFVSFRRPFQAALRLPSTERKLRPAQGGSSAQHSRSSDP
jgi:hypothetical protein